MTEFCILKTFKINIVSSSKPPRAPIIKEVPWIPPLFHWLKVNTDGALIKNSIKAACGGIFRDAEGVCHGCFAQNIPNCSYVFLLLRFLLLY